MKRLIASSKIGLLLGLVIGACIGITACQSSSHEKKIGIIVPIEHKAMDDIVEGFTTTVRANYPHPVSFKVANAQGDLNMQRAIIDQMKNEHYDVIAPIGTAATQMTLSAIHNKPIVSLAAMYSEADRDQRTPCNVTAVHDEISPQRILAFVHQVYPTVTQISLIHSAADKIYADVQASIAAGKSMGITVKPIMVPTLNELYSVSNAIPSDAQAILVLKDNLIVSGIATLEKTAENRHLPLITSDQGSVQDGAGFALGVHERQIGIDGGKLAAQVLAGKPVCSLPMVDMTTLTVFVNKNSLVRENQDLAFIQAASDKDHYTIEFVQQSS